MKRENSNASYFLTFLLFNLCFFCLQLGLVYSQAESFTRLIKFPGEIYFELFATLSAHLFLYLLLSCVQSFLLQGILKRPWHYFSSDQWIIIIWSLCVCAILSANTYYFPLSLFSTLFTPPIPIILIFITLCLSLFGLCLLLINSLFYRSSLWLCLIITTILIFSFINNSNTEVKVQNLTAKPNIIILGIDSLSPESITKENMPRLYDLVENSTQYTNAISPLARTYPAWTSILTGLYVKHHHAEENLVAKSSVNSQASIAWLLSKQGYTTFYATDDRRFNSIDKDFGFRKIIGPKLGVNDVILGTYNDFPLGNLLINFRISSWPFPYNYMNRASFFSYYPKTFSARLVKELALEHNKLPVFLAVHFTLPHWPYAYAESSPEEVNNKFSLEKRDRLYQNALQQVDKQFSSFYTYLERNNYLSNSLIILLSDHGEVLYKPNSRLTNYQNYQGTPPSPLAEYFKYKTATELNKSAGHGSDILSPKQYHSLLAFRIYHNGQLTTPKTKIKTRVALIDLAPTILSFLNIKSPKNMDGISLLNSIINPIHFLPERAFFIESGMFPNQELSEQKAMDIGKQFFKVNSLSGELEIKPAQLKVIAMQKLYGVIEGDWILALYPNDTSYIPVIQNLSTGLWTDDLNSNFAHTTPQAQLKNQLQQFYRDDLKLTIP